MGAALNTNEPRCVKDLESSIDILNQQYEACELIKYDVSGLSQANLGETEEKQFLGFLKLLKIVETTGPQSCFKCQTWHGGFSKEYLISPISINLDLRLVGKIDKQVRSTTAACLNCKSESIEPPAIGPPAS